jgi:hypothetical protein
MTQTKPEIRRQATRNQFRRVLTSLVIGDADVYEGYRNLYAIYCSNNAALEDMKPLFRIAGIDPVSGGSGAGAGGIEDPRITNTTHRI